MFAEALPHETRGQHAQAVGHRDPRAGQDGHRTAGCPQHLFGQAGLPGVEGPGVATQEQGDGPVRWQVSLGMSGTSSIG